MDEGQAPEQWALVELMGHRRMAGRVSEVVQYGVPMLRVAVFVGDAPEPALTQDYGGSSIYCLTPVDEETARRFSLYSRPEPIQRWELPALRELAEGEGDVEDAVVEEDRSGLRSVGGPAGW